MFNVTRPSEVPASLARGQYNHPDVVSVLKPMFFGKCYLCERGDNEDVEVEHFRPHMGDDTLKFDWQNLFYSCSRCNGIKSSGHTNLLDCTDSHYDVASLIILKMPTAPDDDIIVRAADNNPTEQVVNTVKLLDKCYNPHSARFKGTVNPLLSTSIY